MIEHGEATQLGYNSATGEKTIAFVLDVGDEAVVVMGSPVVGKKGDRVSVLTAFTENPNAARDWVQRQKESAASYQSPGGSPGYPSPHGASSLDQNSGVTGTISTAASRVKPQTPRGGIRQLDDGRYIVGLFKNKDASTVLHESGHFFLENLREASGLVLQL